MGSGGVALRVPGLTGAADIGPQAVDRASRGDADLATQRSAAISIAMHAAFVQGDQRFWNQRQIFFGFQGETWPVLVIGAAGATTLAR